MIALSRANSPVEAVRQSLSSCLTSAVVSDRPAAVFSIGTPSADRELDIVLDMVADGIRVDIVSLELRQCRCGHIGLIARSIQGLSSL